MKSCFKMSYRRKMLLAAVIFTALCYKVTAVKQLDMAPEAVDDRYNGCNKQALDLFIDPILKQELNRSKEFHKVWNSIMHTPSCPFQPPGGLKEHTAAVRAYAKDGNFQKTFNNEVATKGGNVSTYDDSFHFKSLHFLLMDTMRLLNDKKECKNVYFEPGTGYKAEKGSKVRFGRFITGLSDFDSQTDREDGETIFNITTCFFISLEKFCEKETDEVLISPAEEFTVVNVEPKEDDDTKYNIIHLYHSKLNSSHNCYIFSRSPADVSTQWLVLVLLGFSLFFFNC